MRIFKDMPDFLQSVSFSFWIAVGAGGVSVVLALVALVSLARVSGKLNKLEEEVEKKAIEFDSIRKGRIELPHSASLDTVSISAPDHYSEHQAGDVSPSGNGLDSGGIQIVRNIRGSVDTPDESHLQEAPIDYQDAHAEPQESAQIPAGGIISLPPQEPPTSSPATDAAYQESAGTLTTMSSPSPDSEIMDVVSSMPSEPAEQNRVVRISVYSDVKKDADFEAVSSTIREKLAATPYGEIELDFTNVMFVYKNELAYLLQLESYCTGRRLGLSFSRCEGELLQAIRTVPSLAARIVA